MNVPNLYRQQTIDLLAQTQLFTVTGKGTI